MAEILTRIPVLVGGPSAGERLSAYAWEQPDDQKQVITGTRDGEPWPPNLPSGVAFEIHTYVARKIAYGGMVVEAFVYDQIAFDLKGIDAYHRQVLAAAMKHWCDT